MASTEAGRGHEDDSSSDGATIGRIAPAEVTGTVVALGSADLGDLLRLSVSAHWNQNEDDWRYLLSVGQGWGIRLDDGTLAASTLVLPYGRFAWVSMVLVLPEQRRRGFATHLLALALDTLRAEGRLPVLDATPAGHPVYHRLGFRDAWSFTRWQRESPLVAPQAGEPAIADVEGTTVRPLADSDWAEILAQDASAFGADRSPLLRDLARRWSLAACVARCGGQLVGWVLGREGRVASQIGPLHAENETIACRLLDHVLAAGSAPVFVDAPQLHSEFAAALRQRGFVEQRPFTRMALADDAPGDASRLWLVAGPELG